MDVEILKQLVKEGKNPLVRLTGELWDDSFGQKGMIARVTKAVDEPHDDLVSFTFDYNENREHNLKLDNPNWFIGSSGKTGTAIEAGHFENPNNLIEDVIFDPSDPVPVELVEENTILVEYLASESEVPYVEWLEAKLEKLVPEAMKTWKKGI